MTPNGQEIIVRVRDLRFAFGPRVIYDGVDIDIPRGKVTAIMGPSGTGKTTLLRLIGGQWRPQSGNIEFDGIDVHKQSRDGLFELRKRMGMLFQNGALLTDLTVFENVAFPLREHSGLPDRMIRDPRRLVGDSRGHLQRRHAGVMHAGDGNAHDTGRANTFAHHMVLMRAAQGMRDPQCRRGGCDSNENGRSKDAWFVANRGLHQHRGHSHVMHAGDAQTHQNATREQPGQLQTFTRDDMQRKPGHEYGDHERITGDGGIVAKRNA